MRIVLVDLGEAPLEALQAYAAKHEVTVHDSYRDFDLSGYDAVVLAGSYEPTVEDVGQTRAWADKLIANPCPLIGLGSGFEVACAALGVDLAVTFEQDTGATKLIPTDDGAKLFQGTDPLVVKESRRWLVDELPKGVQILARSESGIEAFRHKQKPIVALQQLPQDFAYASDAKLVFGNLFGLLGRM